MPYREIPNKAGRLIVLRLLTDLFEIYRQGLIRRGMAQDVPFDVLPIGTVLYEASFRGRGLTLAALARGADMPRSTVERRLETMTRVGLVERRGQHYWVTDGVMMNPPADIPRALRAILEAAERVKKL